MLRGSAPLTPALAVHPECTGYVIVMIDAERL